MNCIDSGKKISTVMNVPDLELKGMNKAQAPGGGHFLLSQVLYFLPFMFEYRVRNK